MSRLRGKSRGRGSRRATAAAPPPRVLYAAAEVYPFIKTGGLADVAAFLPRALRESGLDVRIMLPAYRAVLAGAAGAEPAGSFSGSPELDGARLLRTVLPGTDLPVYLLDAPRRFDRNGSPYQDESGRDFPDNAERFALFCRAIAALARDRARLEWRPDVVHCNDWHTGLAPALLADAADRPATVFTIHSLAYQGNFPREVFAALGLPARLWTPAALEFHGMLSFIKGGLVFADQLLTVSPTHAREMLGPEHGFGLDGVLRGRRQRLRGILNGVDYGTWDPRRDPHLASPYWSNALAGKRTDKLALQAELGLASSGDAFLIGHIARLTHQKGADLLLAALPELLREPELQLALLGEGDADLKAALAAAARAHSGRVAVRFGFSEPLAHRMQAGCDAMLLPSRFEPCGLTQLYGMRYGTVPIVRATGGLMDTVVDVSDATLRDRSATGFHFGPADAPALAAAVRRALALRRSSAHAWRQVMRTGMKQEFDWARSAAEHAAIYSSLASSKARGR